jgi:hypothetical protein
MTTLVTQPLQNSGPLNSSMLASLETAVSDLTKEVGRSVDALRIRPSPASLQSASRVVAGDKPLDERLFDALAAVKILTAQVAMHLDREWRDKLFRQMDSLHDAAEWELDDEPIQQSSFATFLKAIVSISPQRRPGLGLSHSGNLIAAWKTGADRLTIEFLPKDRVRWVLAIQRDDEPDRFAGQTPVARLTQGLEPYHPERWFFHESESDESAR